jgi:hypothetical protein
MTGVTGATGITGATGPSALLNLVDGNASGSVRGIHTNDSITMGVDAVQIGTNTAASGEASFAQGVNSAASGYASHAEGYNTTASGYASHVEGYENTASGDFAHAEGYESTASGYEAHAEGSTTTASGGASHAEGSDTTASGGGAHAEGSGTIASNYETHAEGFYTIASGEDSHAEGSSTTASGFFSHAEGIRTEASGIASHAEGLGTTAEGASGDYSHAEGFVTSAVGWASHAEGSETTANGVDSHAANQGTIAQNACQTAIGKYNVASAPALDNTQYDDAFIIGNGTETARRNAFRVQFTGDVHSASGVYTTGADYAEMFEWQDGNASKEDRRGFFVTLEGEYIRKATAEDHYLLGVISAAPSVIGDASGCNWQGMFERDEWGDIIYELAEVQEKIPVYDPASKQLQIQTKTSQQLSPKLNPAYEANRPYAPRSERAEWAAVGLLGKLIARDDGSCQPNGFCRPNAQGIATSSNQGYLVLKRLAADKVLILLDGVKSIRA